MARTNIDIDDAACEVVMRRYRLRTKRDAVNYALRSLAGEAMSDAEALAMEGSAWDGDLDAMRESRALWH
jgi:Arc/MetJ family transcription regulator